uniref:Calpain catalytic domain-containing protein n=1 Tax=Syphacia muris TaxID=451379 RepID=A0A158R453_9BILA
MVNRKTKKRQFKQQDYKKLKKYCAAKGKLFVDVEFPPTSASLFLDSDKSHANIVWKRPGELADNPRLFVEGASPNDVAQGILGNCWFVSACSALSHNQKLLDKVVPDAAEQEWGDDKPYCGIFRFCFWRFDAWTEVVVDDLLPTRHGRLLFARSKTPNEFWSALLEKAFAKLYGCYENLIGGQLPNALQDVSGGVAETINIGKFLNGDLTDSNSELFRTLKNALDRKALVIAAIAAKHKDEIEESLDCGLVIGHAYAVTAVRLIELDAKKPVQSPSYLSLPLINITEHQKVIRLQNPWGEKEWNGPWSDGSKEWLQVTDARKKEMGITVDEDGEFWMPWDQFLHYFTDVSLCQIFEVSDPSTSREYCEWRFHGEWMSYGRSGSPNDRAGGCLNFLATFCSNPQYRFDVLDDNTEIMLAVSQREPSEGQKIREPYVTIGIHVMKVENNRRYRLHQPVESVATSDYTSACSVFLHLKNLLRGRYVAFPTTYAPREHAEYLFRIYSEHDCYPKELKKHMPTNKFSLCGGISCVSRITVLSAEFPTFKGLYFLIFNTEIYCELTTNGENVRTTTVKMSKPVWNESFVFYKRETVFRFVISLYEKRILRDKLLCETSIDEAVNNEVRTVDASMRDRNGDISGSLKLVFQSYDDPLYL